MRFADELEAARDADGLWTQHRLGDARYLGVGHGFAGNSRALANRRPVDVDAVLARLALRDGPLANWPPAEGSRAGRDPGAVVSRRARASSRRSAI